MSRLLSREKFPPLGFAYFEPKTKWRPPDFASFATVVQMLIAHRVANPAILKGKATDYETVADEVDQYTALRLEAMGHTAYVTKGGGPQASPKSLSPLRRVQRLAAGAVAISDFFKAREDAVAPDLSAARGAVCAECPKNEPGGLESFFTVPASTAIRAALARLKSMNLATPHDEKLNVCAVCLCPMKLKVHFPIAIIRKRLAADVVAELREVPDCWIPKELDLRENP